ncbi:MAG TPA: hypothetical protein VJM51_01510 [Dehalococcoidia bacterium]|nr:hypothetical protein [Dehalococcoidia bacterium]
MATTGEKSLKITVSLGDKELYRAIRHAAIEQDKTLREVVVEALQEWLERQEELEDLAAIAEAEGEETLPWEKVKAEMREAREAKGAR